MNKLIAILSAAFLLLNVNSANAQAKKDWAEKTAFHKVMSQTFHPMEEGNYKPIRERSGEMVAAAIAWQKSPVPAEFKNVKGIKKNLKKLVNESKELNKKIKANCKDAEIKDDLTELHDIFHNIVGLCEKE